MYAPPDPSAPWWLAGSAIAGAVVIKTMDWWLNRRQRNAEDGLVVANADGNTALIDALKERITSLESRQAWLENRITEEIKLRLSAIEELARLRIRVLQLESLLRANGIDAPSDPTVAEPESTRAD